MRLRIILVAALLFAAGGMAPDVFCASNPDQGDAQMEIVSDDIAGVALYPDGETPVRDLPVRIWSIDRQRMIYRTSTDNDGVFEVPAMRVGRCYIFVGRVKVDIQVVRAGRTDLHQRHDIVVVVPHGMLVSAAPQIMDVLIAPLIMQPPAEPRVVSP